MTMGRLEFKMAQLLADISTADISTADISTAGFHSRLLLPKSASAQIVFRSDPDAAPLLHPCR